MSALQGLAQEKIWFDKSRYDEAERQFYEGPNGIEQTPQVLPPSDLDVKTHLNLKLFSLVFSHKCKWELSHFLNDDDKICFYDLVGKALQRSWVWTRMLIKMYSLNALQAALDKSLPKSKM